MKIKFPFSRFVIDEESMWPAYKPGDHVLTFNWGKLGIGNAVVFRKGAKFYVKRVSSIKAGLIHVAGDNMAKSEKMPPVLPSAVVGRIVLRY